MMAAQQTHDSDGVVTAPQVSDVVLGLGPTGLACARHLYARGRDVVVMDSRSAPPAMAQLRAQLPDVRVVTGGFDAAIMRQASRIVVSPGVALEEPSVREAAACGIEVIGEIELFARAVNAPVLAITGSNGKSTVTALLGDILAAAGMDAPVGGNLGTNALDLLQTSAPDAYVLELSSFQLESTSSLRPRVACVLNLSPDHMDRHGDLVTYAAAKARIFDGADTAVVNLDDPMVNEMVRDVPTKLGFSIAGANDAFATLTRDACSLVLGERILMPAAQVPLVGRHNLANVLAACCMAEAFGASHDAMRRAVHAFVPLKHRCQLVIERAGVRWVNDSKGTNVGATVAAIEGLQQGRNLVLIAGGVGKDQDFAPLGDAISRHVHTLVLLGRDAERIDAAVPLQVKRARSRDLREAVALAHAAARAGDCVVLSPACASFDMFEGYRARGDAFIELVMQGPPR